MYWEEEKKKSLNSWIEKRVSARRFEVKSGTASKSFDLKASGKKNSTQEGVKRAVCQKT